MRFQTKFKVFFPHLLTSIRITLSPFLILFGVLKWKDILIVLAILAIVSDLLDDYFSKKWYTKTDFSEKLDMTGDKVFEISILLALIPYYPICFLLLLLEVVLVITNITHFYKTSYTTSPSLGKGKTICLWITIFIALINLKINQLAFVANGLLAVSLNLLFIYLIQKIILVKEELKELALSELEKTKAHQQIMQEKTIEIKNLQQIINRRYK